MKPKKTKEIPTKKVEKKSKLERIMFEENIQRNVMQQKTELSQPVLSRMINGETDFRKRTIRDMEKFLKRPAEQFLGFEGESVVISTNDDDKEEEKEEKEEK